MRRGLIALVFFAVLVTAPDALALQAGAGRSDVTPPTGFYTMGYVRSDAVARGQHTRLYARAIVLEQGGRKLALVATDLGFTPGGLTFEVGKKVASRGFDERNIVISASHTHSGPAGWSPWGSDNFVPPTTGTPTKFSLDTDRQLYGFLIERVALAIERADSDLGPARAGWGNSELLGVTQNRSLEAFLANFGKDVPYGEGNVNMVPGGYPRTIDPSVDVLRVDRVRGKRRVPLGAWLDFADHGTVDPYTFGVYSGDHQGPAARDFEAAVRRAGHVPRGDEVVGAYGNSDAGDMSAGLGRRGPAKADEVGRAEANAMLKAWRRAGRRLSGSPPFDWRWTRMCFCGQPVRGGEPADTAPVMGFPFFTGSEENRGPLFDVTQVNHEGDRLPLDVGPQGRKIPAAQRPAADFPSSLPVMSIHLGDRLMVTVPGEMTAEMGRRTRDALTPLAEPVGVKRVVIVGYANDYVHYFTTPEEYEQQHYEGGSTVFGKFSSYVIRDSLVDLTTTLAAAKPAPDPHPFDTTNGVAPDYTPYGTGAQSATALSQPVATPRLARAGFSWQGGERGLDRPLDRAFVRIERRVGRRWRQMADDLGLLIVWRVDDNGRYTAQWQVPIDAKPGSYRFVITANRYGLKSSPFRVSPARSLHVRIVGIAKRRVRIALDYPPVDDANDLVSHPKSASGGRVIADVARRRVTARARRGEITVPLGRAKTLTVLAAYDRFGNRAGRGP
ncbi:MAG TPA: neutral/alkaline non-lysosomal ceramidase N-terminal domain-containing protein [Thermoleophilaceae bacterium]|nr:neutral/alkaline non-lysosomal ceramidase N-terminal domain-containing protein [Thermoleophilaceae bacterium]